MLWYQHALFALGTVGVLYAAYKTLLLNKDGFITLKTTDKMENDTLYLPGDYRVAEYTPGEFKVQVYSFRQFTTSSFWGGRKLQREYYWHTLDHTEVDMSDEIGCTKINTKPRVFTSLTSAREYIAEQKRISQEYPKFHNA